MIFFIRKGRYVPIANKLCFWMAVLTGVGGVPLSYALLRKADQPLLGVIMMLLFLGCVVFDCLFLAKGKRSYSIIACGYGIAASMIPVVLQCVNLQSNAYIGMTGYSILTVIATVWAMLGSKKLSQEWDESVKICASLKGRHSRIAIIALYVLGEWASPLFLSPC